MTEWIRVDEQLPVEGTPVLVYIPEWQARETAYINHDYPGVWFWAEEQLKGSNAPSHWMPLPAPPTTSDGNQK